MKKKGTHPDNEETNHGELKPGTPAHEDHHGEAEEQHDDDHEEHIDERWLVSYADMMTLLFGLFVMLYSMAMDHKGDIDQQLKSMSEQTFAENATPPPVATPNQEVKLKAEIEKAQKEREVVKLELEKLKIEQEAKVTQMQTDLVAAQQAVETAKAAQTAAQEAQAAMAARAAATAAAALAKGKPVDKTPELQQKIAELEKKIKEKTPEKPKNREPELEQKITELEKKIKAMPVPPKDIDRKIASVEQSEKEIEKNKEQIQDLTKKNDELQAKIADLEKNAPTSRRFMMVVLKWSSEKHDLDLTVTDPQGKVFNFKKRKYAGHPGEFTLDSRSGPGAEIWQTEQLIPGVYTINWKLYNAYGNTSDVVYSGVISSNAGKIDIREKRMPASVGSSSTIRVKVDAEGRLTRM